MGPGWLGHGDNQRVTVGLQAGDEETAGRANALEQPKGPVAQIEQVQDAGVVGDPGVATVVALAGRDFDLVGGEVLDRKLGVQLEGGLLRVHTGKELFQGGMHPRHAAVNGIGLLKVRQEAPFRTGKQLLVALQ